MILERVNKVREFRLSSTRANTKKAAENPTLFASILEHKNQYIAIPKVSSQNRRYIPMDYLDGEIIPGDKLFTMPNASFYEFGVLMSNVHMAWMRAVCGRLKSDYSYSNTIVYNNFPWPVVTEKNREQIEKSAQEILKARTLYPSSNLAALYDPLTMPAELRRAHTANDKAVMAAYGFSTKMTEADCVGELMKLYQKMQKDHPDSEYIFLQDNGKLYTDSMLKYHVNIMIYENDIRDDNGNYFEFRTHRFRHTFGVKLTEMKLDDDSIARLLGHKDTRTIPHYRRLRNEALAEDTKAVRDEMNELLAQYRREKENAETR